MFYKPVRSRRKRLASQWIADSPLNASAPAYVDYLTERGYSAETIAAYFGCVAHFAHWLRQQRADVADIDEELVSRFVDQHLPRCRCAPRCQRARNQVRAALRHLLAILRADGQCAPQSSPVPEAIATELEDFDHHLTEVRGLSAITRSTRVHHVRDFLIDRFGTGSVQLSVLRPADVAQFMTHYTARWAPASIRAASTSLRSYFAFRASRGESTTALAAALPQVAQWRLAGLPRGLSEAEITTLINTFDVSTATGQRDYAITRCLLDLGLRATEVAALRLDDIDWRTGTLHIRGKGKRIDAVPLPNVTGRAIAQYLQHGRPSTLRRELFMRHRPPINTAASPAIVRNAVRYAAKRGGLEHRIQGTHIFRHTLAGRLIQNGAPFKQIADLLRHRQLDTTTIYAKVDLPALDQVALPWPGRSV